MNFKNLTKSLGLGIGGLMLLSWEYSAIIPQGYTCLTMVKYHGYTTGAVPIKLYNHEIYSLAYTFGVLLIGYTIFKKRNVN